MLHVLFKMIWEEEQDTKERIFEQVWVLQRHHTTIGSRKDLEQSVAEPDERFSKRPTPRPTGRIATLRIIVEQSIEWDFTIHPIPWLWESIWQREQENLIEPSPTPWCEWVRKSSTSYGIHRTDYGAKWCREDSWPMYSKWGSESGKTAYSSPFSFFWWSTGLWRPSYLRGIQWTAWMRLDDLDFTDDLAFLSYTHGQIQVNATSLASASAWVGLNINNGRSKILKYNSENTNPIALDGGILKYVERFTYPNSIIGEQGGTDEDVRARIGKVRTALLQLKNIWS